MASNIIVRHAPAALMAHPRPLFAVYAAAAQLGIDLTNPAAVAQSLWVAEEFVTAGPPPGWSMAYDASAGALQYTHPVTRVSTQVHPQMDTYKDWVARGVPAPSSSTPASPSKASAGAPAQSGAGGPAAPVKNRRGSVVKMDEPSGGYTPAQIIELAEYLTVKLRCEAHEREFFVMEIVDKYLDQVAVNYMPPNWMTYSDQEGNPYYYNAVSGESTYDYPVATTLQAKAAELRKSMLTAHGPGFRGDEVDQWWLFSDGAGHVYYYNLGTEKRVPDLPYVPPSATRTGGKTVTVHGRTLNVTQQQAVLDSETDTWQREKAQREVKSELERIVSDMKNSIEMGGDGRWSMSEYDNVLRTLRKAQTTGLVDDADEFKLRGKDVYAAVKDLVARFEEQEGRRRAEEKRKAIEEEQARQLADKVSALRELQKCSDRLKQFRKMEYTDAVIERSLNGLLYSHESVGQAYHAAYQSISEARLVAPKTATDPMRDDQIATLMKLVAVAKRMTDTLERTIKAELKRRQDTEAAAAEAAEQAKIAAEQAARDAEERRVREEAERLKAEQDHIRQQQELQEKLRRDYEEKIKAQQENQRRLEIERIAMEAEMNKLRQQREERERKEAERLDKWSMMTFASDLDRVEAETQRRLEEAARQKAEEVRREREARQQSELQSAMEERQRQIREQQELIAQQLEEKRVAEERIAAQLRADADAFEAERLRRAKLEEERLSQERAKQEKINEQRAMLDEGDSDTEEEKQQRAEARELLSEYKGDAWAATKENNVKLVRAFFLVHGTKNLLHARSKSKEEGGRTLVHTAAWWGCQDVLEFLITIGADLNAIDSMWSRTTPLIEATRAGRRNIVELLLRQGAKIEMQDYYGDTCLHWAARRGWGTLLVAILDHAALSHKASDPDPLAIVNGRGRKPIDVAANQTIQELILAEGKRQEQREAKRFASVSRVKRGLFKARMIGANVSGTANVLKAQRLRYGKARGGL